MIGGTRATRSTNRLSDRGIRSFIGKARVGTAAKGKLSDGGGLYLTLTPNGTPVWRLKYRIAGKEKLYSIGVFPDVGLDAARTQREVVKGQLREGLDPLKTRQLNRATEASASDETFSGAATDWLNR